jgi:putative spermidine/putrescine transport system substrate-binding protein
MVQSAKTIWDVCDLAPYRIAALGAGGNLEDTDYTIIDSSAIPKELILKWGIGVATFSTILAYRTDMIQGEGPKSMSDLWDFNRFPGKRALNDEPTNNLPFALNALGVPKDEIYPLTEDKLKRAFAKLDELKPHAIWWTVGAQPTQLLADKEVVMAQGYNGRFEDVLKQGLPIKIVWEGAQASASMWGVPKNSPNKDLAMLFIAWTLLPENNGALVNFTPLGPANRDAAAAVPPERRGLLPSTYVNQQIKLDAGFWGSHFDELSQRWKEWRLKG